MLINECKPEFQFKKSSKNAKFGQCLYLVAHLCYEQNRCATDTLAIFQSSGKIAVEIEQLYIYVKYGAIISLQSFKILAGILSKPHDLRHQVF